MTTIGDHIKKARLDRGLTQKQLAAQIGVDPFTILNWETGATNPKLRCMPAITQFLGYQPFPVQPDAPLYTRLKAYRQELGFTWEQLAKLLKLNVSTIQKWEAGKSKEPTQETLEKVDHFLKSF